jgi:hypothetical protein
VNPVTSVVWFDINQGWLWGETPGVGSTGGPKFTVTSYNGGGWDSDSSGSDWLYVDLNEVATGPGQFVSDLSIGTNGLDGHIPNYLPSFSSASGAGPVGSGDGTTLSLGWLFWNEFNAGPSSEVYEVLIPPAE